MLNPHSVIKYRTYTAVSQQKKIHIDLFPAITYYKYRSPHLLGNMQIEDVMQEIIGICKRNGATTVILFGSRAKGTALERSDIDIAVKGVDDIENLREELEEIPTLYTIDLVGLEECQNNLLLEDIEKYGRKIYEKI